MPVHFSPGRISPVVRFARLGVLAVALAVIALGIGTRVTGPQPAHAAFQVFTVNSTADTSAGGCQVSPGDCTLREALEAAAGAADDVEIRFNIPGTDGGCVAGVCTINPATPVATAPAAHALSIDGYSQPGASVNTGAAAGTNAQLKIRIRTTTINGFVIHSRVTVRGINFVRDAGGPTVTIDGTQAVISGSFIGTNVTGTLDDVPAPTGVSVAPGSSQVVVGGPGPDSMNVIAGQDTDVLIQAGATDVAVRGNLIGVNAAGTAAIVAATSFPRTGVSVLGDDNRITENVISGYHNVVSVGSQTYAVALRGDTNLVSGNIIGLNASGTGVIGSDAGVAVLDGASHNRIGAPTDFDRNVISGHDGDGGVVIRKADPLALPPSQTIIQGNYIGLKADGASVAGNQFAGIYLNGAEFTQILDNVISGNGIGISGRLNTVAGDLRNDEVLIRRNKIGTDPAGLVGLLNQQAGIWLSHTDSVVIGGPVAQGNIVSGNGAAGILLGGLSTSVPSVTDLTIAGNYIGQGNSSVQLGNGGDGIVMSYVNGTVLIGEGPGVEGNVIANNGGNGLNYGAGSVNHTVQGNLIHDNGGDGIRVANITTTGIRLTVNSIWNNGGDDEVGLGINLQRGSEPSSAVTLNDFKDEDTGPNGLQNYPLITAAVLDAGQLLIETSLHSTPNTEFRVEFFLNQGVGCNPSGYGEGRALLDVKTVTTDAAGYVLFLRTGAPGPAVPGDSVTATAIAPNGDTSEFSNCLNIPSGTIGVPCQGPIVIALVPGANGHVYCGAGLALVADLLASRAPGVLPDSVSAVFEWNNAQQRFDFWFRGFPEGFQTLTGLIDGRYYFFQTTGSESFDNTGGTSIFAVPGTTSIGPTAAGANGAVWAGNGHSMPGFDTLAILDPATAIFQWNNAQQRFDFWFRGFPDGFQTLTAGIERGKYYFFQTPAGEIIPMN